MKHTQTFLQGALSKGEDWVKNAGSFMYRHRYLVGGAIGGAMIAMAHATNPPSERGMRNRLGSATRTAPRAHHAVATGATSGPPVLLGNMRGLHESST